MKTLIALCAALLGSTAFAAATPAPVVVDPDGTALTLTAGHPSLAKWISPKAMPSPADNPSTPQRVALGEKLFFDARLSIHGRTSCSSCHLPERGWADGVPRSLRFMGQPTPRNSQSVVNAGFSEAAYNWDGKNKSLEQQATGSQGFNGATGGGAKEIGIEDPNLGIERIKGIAGYQALFAAAYPGEAITQASAGKAIAAFERTLISRDTPFDRWVEGDAKAMTPSQVNGLRVFLDPAKGNCAGCHAAPFFSDKGFHNVGLKQYGEPDADLGRYKVQAVEELKGAFKTPGLRDVEATAPYFHDGSVATLKEVVAHYARGGDVKTNLSPQIKPLPLTGQEQEDLVEFLRSLSSPVGVYDRPVLPR
jgi:cytochrome c peroxidase